jgi:hypothetical protein
MTKEKGQLGNMGSGQVAVLLYLNVDVRVLLYLDK